MTYRDKIDAVYIDGFKAGYSQARFDLEQQPCEMTVEKYRQRMIQAFHNADTDELIAVCVLPTEKEFEHLEWLLKNHYKKAPCDEAISREAAIKTVHKMRVVCDTEDIDDYYELLVESFKQLPPVTPQQKYGKWIDIDEQKPDVGISVLVCDDEEDIYLTHITRDGVFFDEWGNKIKGIVAWMPLPESYKGE